MHRYYKNPVLCRSGSGQYPGPGSERHVGVEEDAVAMEECSPVTSEGNAE